MEFCGIDFYCMSWHTWNKSRLIVVIFCHSPASDMLEFDFHVLILHLMSSYSCVNNPMHIEIYVLFYLRFLFICWNSAMNCACICRCVLYCLCWKCVLYWNVNIYFVINHYHFFCNIATWTACVYHVDIHVLRNKWYIYIYNNPTCTAMPPH